MSQSNRMTYSLDIKVDESTYSAFKLIRRGGIVGDADNGCKSECTITLFTHIYLLGYVYCI